MAVVLVVDDEPDLRFLMRKLLERNGHHVLEASNGAHALDALEGQSVEVVVTDLEMPRMDGHELISALRAQHPDVAIVVWADNLSPDVDADAVFAKPYGGSEIAAVVDRLA